MSITAEVVLLGTHWYCLCRECEWRSAPQDSQSDALDRGVVHDHFNHDDDDPRPADGADEWVLKMLDEFSW